MYTYIFNIIYIYQMDFRKIWSTKRSIFAAILNCSGTFIRYLGSLGKSFGVVLLGQFFVQLHNL